MKYSPRHPERSNESLVESKSQVYEIPRKLGMTWFLTTFVCLFSLSSMASSLQYAVIVDAGSSGSRAHVFEYAKSLPMIPVPVIKDINNKMTKPGLSSYANTPDLAGPSLKPILDSVANDLQSRGVNLSQVPVSVLATAGMRLLPQDQQDAIYASVRRYIHDNYAFSLNDNNVLTISGTMEGVYGWMDVNYLQNNFIHPSETTGTIDMGGASTQIAFATTDTSKPANEVVVTINHRLYRIYSQSFLGLGQDQALNTMTTYPSAPNCFPTGYPSDSQISDFNFSPCSIIYSNIINSLDVTQNILPTEGQKFVATGGIYYNYKFFNILQTPTQSALQSKINAICYQPWSTLQSNYPDESTSNLSNYCANGVYFDDLIYNTYQVQGSQLNVIDHINGTGIDWTLGALLFSLVQ